MATDTGGEFGGNELRAGLGLDVGTPVFVEYGRVDAMDAIGAGSVRATAVAAPYVTFPTGCVHNRSYAPVDIAVAARRWRVPP